MSPRMCQQCELRPAHKSGVNPGLACRECFTYAEWELTHARDHKRPITGMHCPVCHPKLDPRSHCKVCGSIKHRTDACDEALKPKHKRSHTEHVRDAVARTAESNARGSGPHAGCDHPATPKERAKCRKRRAKLGL